MPSPLCHFELMSANPVKAKAFYGSVFGWEFDEKSMPGYTIIQTGQDPPGGLFPSPAASSGACMNAYFKVADIDQTLGRAEKGGAKVLVPKSPIPGLGYFAMFADPEGIAIGLMEPHS